MKGDHALALTAYVVLSVAVVGVSVDRFETNQATSPRSASAAATPDGAAGGEPHISPGNGDPRASHDGGTQAGPDRAPGVGGPTAAELLPTGVAAPAAPGATVPGAQPRPPTQVSDSTPTTPAPETSTNEPSETGDTGSTMPCPGDDSVLVTPVPSGALCPSPEPAPTEEALLDDLDPLGAFDRLDLPGMGAVSDEGSEG